MTLRVAHLDSVDDSPTFLVCTGKISLSVLMAHVMCSHLSMQEEDILEQVKNIEKETIGYYDIDMRCPSIIFIHPTCRHKELGGLSAYG